MFLLLALLVSATPSPPNNTVTKTMAPVNLFVDAAGNDANGCTGAGPAAACLTPQGAINKVPKGLRHSATVTLGVGTFPAFYVSGFTADLGAQQATAGLTIRGTFANSTVTSGCVSACAATGGTHGSLPTFGTLTTAAAGWTVNDLRGRYVTLTGGSGSGQRRLISSNTANDITIVGRWDTDPTGTTVFSIQEPASIINTAVAIPPTGTEGEIAGAVSVFISGNNLDYQNGAITISGLRFVASFAEDVLITDNASVVALTYCQFFNAANAVYTGPLSLLDFAVGGTGPAYLNFHDSYVSGAGGGNINASTTNPSGQIVIVRSLFNFNNYAVVSFGAGVRFKESEGLTCDDICVAAPRMVVSGSRFSCAAPTRIAMANDVSFNNPVQALGGGLSTVSSSFVSGCDRGVDAIGVGTNFFVSNLSGSATTTALSARLGGLIQYTAATTITGGTQDVKVDTAYTGTLASISSGTCKDSSVNSYGSRICKQ